MTNYSLEEGLALVAGLEQRDELTHDDLAILAEWLEEAGKAKEAEMLRGLRDREPWNASRAISIQLTWSTYATPDSGEFHKDEELSIVPRAIGVWLRKNMRCGPFPLIENVAYFAPQGLENNYWWGHYHSEEEAWKDLFRAALKWVKTEVLKEGYTGE